MSLLSNRIQSIKPSPTLEITQLAQDLKAKGKKIISLSAGEPDFDTPQFIKEAAWEALKQGYTKYTAVDGIIELKKAIQDKFRVENDLTYTTDEIIVGCGAKHILFNAFMVTLNKGDEVIIPTPFWPSYPYMVTLCEGTPIIVECPQFKITADQLEKAITPHTKWLLLNSPNNPSGAIYSKEELGALAEVIRNHDHVYVMSDDIYEHIRYDDIPFYTFAQVAPDLKDRTLTINGVSKSFSMTGWRIGYAAGPKEIIKAMAKLQSQSTSNPTSISQYAAVAGLLHSGEFLAENNKLFLERRDMVVRMLNEAPGLTCAAPSGAFYVYPSCAGVLGKKTPDGKRIESDKDFAAYLLEAAEVAIVPGIAFGLSPFFRLSYAEDTSLLEKACQRIQKACSTLKD